ncbi:MAG: hypothetical protein EPO22_06185 [Dehalococcoidia bacterium]|nr:MAG: hypothetical protein EPO22_06185 [Dehalococcoidia bacterium]
MLFKQRRIDTSLAPRLRIVDPGEATPDADVSPRTYGLLVAGAVALGFLLRASFIFAADFPIGDGGLFYQMVRDLEHAGYALPTTTTYNGDGIPYAYPPLMLYAAAFVDRLTPLGLLDVLRILPLIGSTLAVVAFALLARDMLASRTAAAFAAFCFAMLPRGLVWTLMGGGLTRGFGLAFAIATIHAAYLLYTRGQRRYAALAAVFGALVLATHIEMAWFAVFSCALLLAAYGRDRASVIASMLVCAGVAALTSPWWLTVVARDGFQPFVSAANARDASQSNPLVLFIQFRFTSEILFPASAALGLLGAIACIAARRFVLPSWIVAAALLDTRAFGTVAAAPLALLAGIAFADVILPLVARPQLRLGSLPGAASTRRIASGAAMPIAVTAVLACYMLLLALVSTPRPLSAMSVDERAAMQWATDNTPPGSRFAVVSGDQWALDRTSEWLPALTGRVSSVTPQGYEWAGGSAFSHRLSAYRELQQCAGRDEACLTGWSLWQEVGYDYVYIPKLAPRSAIAVDNERECCAALRMSLRADPAYEAVYDGPGATIFRHRT